MLHWIGVQERTATAENTLLYADSFDPLIDDGWEVDRFEDDGEDGSGSWVETPSKKRKTR